MLALRIKIGWYRGSYLFGKSLFKKNRPVPAAHTYCNLESHPKDGFRDQRKNLSHKSNDILTIFERGAYVTEKTTIERKLSDQEQHLHVKATS